MFLGHNRLVLCKAAKRLSIESEGIEKRTGIPACLNSRTCVAPAVQSNQAKSHADKPPEPAGHWSVSANSWSDSLTVLTSCRSSFDKSAGRGL